MYFIGHLTSYQPEQKIDSVEACKTVLIDPVWSPARNRPSPAGPDFPKADNKFNLLCYLLVRHRKFIRLRFFSFSRFLGRRVELQERLQCSISIWRNVKYVERAENMRSTHASFDSTSFPSGQQIVN